MEDPKENLYFKVGKSFGISGNLNEKEAYIKKINQYIQDQSSKSKEEVDLILKDFENFKKKFEDFEKNYSELKGRLYDDQIAIIQKLENLKKELSANKNSYSQTIDEIISKNSDDLTNITNSFNLWRELTLQAINDLSKKEITLYEKIQSNHIEFIARIEGELKKLINLENGYQLGNAIKIALSEKI